MKGERTTKRLGVETNKTLKRDPYGHSDHKLDSLRVQIQNKIMHGGSDDEQQVSHTLCEKCSRALK